MTKGETDTYGWPPVCLGRTFEPHTSSGSITFIVKGDAEPRRDGDVTGSGGICDRLKGGHVTCSKPFGK